MKTHAVRILAMVALATAGWAAGAPADTADADCQVRRKGDLAKDASGPCTFSQRQGYVDITLRNGGTYNLSPGQRPDHFKDQNGHGVERTAAAGDSQTYKWDKMQIVVTFGGAAAAGDARVAGTGFHATGEIPCATAASQPMRPCRFGVVRQGGGNATVTVFLPGGGERTIRFANGAATSDGSGAVKVEKAGDLNTVRIGADERFEIPDAVIAGG